ncbi:MAG TPA: DUF58 domain-containing protein [Polyangiaceae bacterium]|nr:DUF58 domain-containing protein [Polyangiaceae bacterium]
MGSLFDADFLRRLESLALSSRRTSSGERRGEQRSKKRGSGVTFADHRPYAAGDDIRFLDVASYQRLGKLLVRLYEEDEDRSLCLLLDGSASMSFGDGRKFELAKQLAAALGYVGLSGLDRVGAYVLREDSAERMPPLRGKRRVLRMLRFLSAARANGATDLGRALRPVALAQRRGALAILLTDLYDPRGFATGIDVLRWNRLEPCVIQLVDEREARPPLQGDVRAVDVETDQSLELTVTRAGLDAVAKLHAERTESARRYCLARGVPFVVASVDQPFDRIVLEILRRGGIVE